MQRLDAFTSSLSKKSLREVDIAVALAWFVTHADVDKPDVTPRELADLMVRQRLSGSVNASRLGRGLGTHTDIVRGIRPGSFRIKKSADDKLSERFGGYADLSKSPVKDLVISDSIGLGGRRPLDVIRREANGTYERGFYNSAAVMCRRIVEMLLIEALEKHAAGQAIRDGNDNLLGFADLIAVAKSGKFIKLSRSAPAGLEKVKELGDAAAHHRHFVASKKDVDDLNPNLALLVSELAGLAFN